MWYCAWTKHIPARCCYAESDDGLTWRKPNVGIHEYEGSRDNNIIIQSDQSDVSLIDDVSVIDDPDDSEWPLKMLLWDGSFETPESPRGIHAARSKDGIHWDRLGTVLDAWGDRFNAVPHKIDGKYVVYGRAPNVLSSGGTSGTGRVVYRSESDDLMDWSEPELVIVSDIEDPQDLQIYSSTAFQYESTLLGSIERMHMSPDVLDPEIIWSHDRGHKWNRSRTRPAFITRGAPGSWDGAWVNLPSNGPTLVDNELWFYYSGRSGAHCSTFPYNNGGVGLAKIRRDGFASLQATEQEGTVLTHPMTWPKAELAVNVDCRRNIKSHPKYYSGHLRVAVVDEQGKDIDGYTGDDCQVIQGNSSVEDECAVTICWENGRKLAELAGQSIAFRFMLQDAHLYGFKAR
jgi:hypothetical protein